MSDEELLKKYMKLAELAKSQKKIFELPFKQYKKMYLRKTCPLTGLIFNKEDDNSQVNAQRVLLINHKLGYTPANVLVVANVTLILRRYAELDCNKSAKKLQSTVNLFKEVKKFNIEHGL